MPMKQPHTDFGYRGETGEKEPKGASSSDTSGERKVKVPREDREAGKPGESGEHEPKGAKASDSGGERKVRIMGGVGQGKADSIGAREGSHLGKHDGRTGEMNTGRKEGHFYHHAKDGY
jgi:hypothetical protein